MAIGAEEPLEGRSSGVLWGSEQVRTCPNR